MVTNLGLIFGMLGAALLAWGPLGFLRSQQAEGDRVAERRWTVAGGIFVFAGFTLELVARLHR